MTRSGAEPAAARSAQERPPRFQALWDRGAAVLVPLVGKRRQVDAPQVSAGVRIQSAEDQVRDHAAGDSGFHDCLRLQVTDRAPGRPRQGRVGIGSPFPSGNPAARCAVAIPCQARSKPALSGQGQFSERLVKALLPIRVRP